MFKFTCYITASNISLNDAPRVGMPLDVDQIKTFLTNTQRDSILKMDNVRKLSKTNNDNYLVMINLLMLSLQMMMKNCLQRNIYVHAALIKRNGNLFLYCNER